MDRQEFLDLLNEYGDAIVYYTSKQSSKPRYTVCTLDLKTPYIVDKRQKLAGSNKAEEVLVFSWDLDRFKSIDPSSVLYMTPLSDVLQN